MKEIKVRALIQARMTSERFPGKVLAPFNGLPLISHVIERVSLAVGSDSVILVTSKSKSDDPLAYYAESTLGVRVFRGSLHNVVDRFQQALVEHPCDWFVRICADSPLIDARLIQAMLKRINPQFDLISNTVTRTFPKGQSVEVIKTDIFAKINANELEASDAEHVTQAFYRERERFKINRVTSIAPELALKSMAVDTIEDLKYLHAYSKTAYPPFDIDFGSLVMPQKSSEKL